jgi:peptide/nickel transport system substrate-binding protein
MSKRAIKVSRRDFLFGSAMTAVGVALSACGGGQPAPATPVPANTKAPSGPTAIPTSAATATPVPTLAVEAKEAPALAELVAAGTLPPLADRLPKVPLVLSPVDGIGQYGGRIRTFSSWDGHWHECQYGHSPLRWIDDGMGIAPGMCDTWEANADNTEWTVHVREGLKWSDGEPCTVDDVLFWWNDLTLAPPAASWSSSSAWTTIPSRSSTSSPRRSRPSAWRCG